MSDLNIPERRETDGEEAKAETTPETTTEEAKAETTPETTTEEAKAPPGHLEVIPPHPGNVDIVQMRLLEAINKKLTVLVQLLDARLPRNEEVQLAPGLVGKVVEKKKSD